MIYNFAKWSEFASREKERIRESAEAKWASQDDGTTIKHIFNRLQGLNEQDTKQGTTLKERDKGQA